MSKLVDIGVLGAEGRMGGAIIRALRDEPRARLTVALTSPMSANIGQDASLPVGLSPCGVLLSGDIEDGLDQCDVMIDFSSPKAAIDAALGMHATRCHTLITGTTGYSETEESALTKASESITLVKSGNFSLGVNMLEALVEQAASRLGDDWDIEISDVHHKHKVDAPSGTALMLGEAAARGRGVSLKQKQVLSRAGRGQARRNGDIGFSAIRGGGVIGDHDVHFASDMELLTLSHRALDRSIFAKGAITAALWAHDKPKGLYSMRDVLGV